MQCTHSGSANRHICYSQMFDADKCDSSQELQVVKLTLSCKAHMINVMCIPFWKGGGGVGWGNGRGGGGGGMRGGGK